jgi:hypothetical protein
VHHLLHLAGRVPFGVKNSRKLIFDHRHLAVVIDELGENILGDALAGFFLQSIEAALSKPAVLSRRVRVSLYRNERPGFPSRPLL